MSEQAQATPTNTGYVAPQNMRDDDGLLDYTTRRRLMFADAVGEQVGDVKNADPKVLSLYLKSLDGIDKTAMGRKRLTLDEKQNEDNKATAANIVLLLKATGPNNPFTAEAIAARGQATDAAIPKEELPEVEFVPGETHRGTENETYVEFAKRYPDALK